ncbi:gluconokinase (plasmid) [Rhizobium grahamii]|uniref:Gluconokinase n=1 Tax=Rhizobium grahamii TaxID=1120045 RepID=A0A5Q0CEW7_9HYPH|nr:MULTISPECIES: gluconokinase [Rhizobium]QFY63872.1 gluconokinase [Rhizobium grahamii]QRM52883.1 gluconokinase [Rhizobium sp. BG6]
MSMAASRLRSERVSRIVLMGVSGCGKTTVGVALGARLGLPYIDGDDLHPPENIAKMSRSEPLDDSDRWPWLAQVGDALASLNGGAIVGCSALKRVYRERISREVGAPVTFVHLAGSRGLIGQRLAERSGHFMPTSLLDSQFASLEPPSADEQAITVDIDQPFDKIIAHIVRALEEQDK